MAANYREGEFKPALLNPEGTRVPHGWQYSYARNVMGGTDFWHADKGDKWQRGSSATGAVDWNDLASVQKFSGIAKREMTQAQARASNLDPEKDFQLSSGSPSPVHNYAGMNNPFHSQGLGPKSYVGSYTSDVLGDQARWYEASYRKFETRSQELKGIASAPAAGGFGAGTQEAYDEAQAAKKLLGKPFAEGASAAALLRQERGPRAGGGGGGGGGGSRQTSRAAQGERRRLASNDRTTGGGGGTRRKRLRAANLLGQPLGGGSQSAAQVLG